jgi:Cys-tRNA synthase (O-phospho-L-seryl-tRNA:Cys-tRNA synthase)
MASEKEADIARDQYSDFLLNLGAHGITIDEVKRKGETTFAVVAFFEKKPEGVPDTLKIQRGKKTLEVPLLTRVTEKFKPEK